MAKLAGGAMSHFVVFDDPAAHFALEALGGLATLRERLGKDGGRAFAMKDFVGAYREYRDGQRYVPGFGRFDGQNIVLIGDQPRALAVYAASRQSLCSGLVQGVDLLSSTDHFYAPLSLPMAIGPEHLYVQQPPLAISDLPWMQVQNPLN